jgi:hypothetical protein
MGRARGDHAPAGTGCACHFQPWAMPLSQGLGTNLAHSLFIPSSFFQLFSYLNF